MFEIVNAIIQAETSSPIIKQPGCAGSEGGLPGGPIWMILLMFVVFYFLLIRPQQKKQKAHRELLGKLKKGDSVVTNSGIYGKIIGLGDRVATIEIADRVRIKILRSQIAGVSEDDGKTS